MVDRELALQLDLYGRHRVRDYRPSRRLVTMINGGNATVYVSNMDSAIQLDWDRDFNEGPRPHEAVSSVTS